MRYGQKGGDGPNTGKKATIYEATLPDGSVGRKKSFHIDASDAFMSIYEHEGVWRLVGITNAVAEKDGVLHPVYSYGICPDQIATPAKRVDPKTNKVEQDDSRYHVVRDRNGDWYYFKRFDERGESYWWHGLSMDCVKPVPKVDAEAILKALKDKSPENTYFLSKA
jgi:hypothetical protein